MGCNKNQEGKQRKERTMIFKGMCIAVKNTS
jgi:hypothetical protein